MSAPRIIGYLGEATAYGRVIYNTEAAQITIAKPHWEIHEQDSYIAAYSGLADTDDTIELRVESPTNPANKRAHAVITFESALASTVELWATTTKTHASGNAIVPINRWLGSSNASILTVCHTPAGSQAGAATILRYIGSTSVSGKGDTGGSADSRGELVLPPSNAILIKMTSRVDSNAMTIAVDWYEETEESS